MSAEGIGEPTNPDPLNAEWNSGLARFPEATIFHTSQWAKVLAETYGYKPFYFNWERGERPKALCLFEVNSWVTGKRAVSLPFSDACPALGVKDAAELEAILRLAAEVGREKGWQSIEVRSTPEDWKQKRSNSFYTHELDLSPGVEKLFQGCGDATRRAVRKAERAGVLVQIRSDHEAIEEYFELHCLTRKKHGVPPQPFKFFSNIHRHIIQGGLGFTALARLKDQTLAGAVFFMFGGKALYKFGASDPEMDSARPSNLVMWRAIQHLTDHLGSKTLSFGRTDPHQEGLRRYKLGWGTEEKTISYLKYHLASESYSSGKRSASSKRLFSAVPMSVSRRIGAALYPHLG